MSDIARLRIELQHVQPQVVRRLEVPLDIRLDILHLAFQATMGWDNYHRYEFKAGKTSWGIPDEEFDLPEMRLRDAGKTTLAKMLGKRSKSFLYIYDFGDNWHHNVTIEAIIPAEPTGKYPRLIAAEGRCPPEDVGGPWGYEEYLEVMADPEHELHQQYLEWRGPDYDPHKVDKARIRRRLAAVARKVADTTP